MSSTEPSDRPEPMTDPAPDSAPGGPADAVEGHEELPPKTPDQPRSAQVEDGRVPDEIEKPEKMDEGERHVHPSDDDPA